MKHVDSEQAFFRGDAYFFAYNGAYEQMKQLHDAVEKIGMYCRIYPEKYRSDYWLEILPKGATKANAVVKLKELLAYDRLVCFGDSANDSEMFDVCDEKYAVENADEWLKGKATGVVGCCEENGVAKWLAKNAEIVCRTGSFLLSSQMLLNAQKRRLRDEEGKSRTECKNPQIDVENG